MKRIEIEKVGPISNLAFDLDGDGGVCVFRGHNGAGKSHAITATAALADKDFAKGLTSQDGADFGVVKGLGVQLTLGRRSRRIGELEVQSIGVKEDLSAFVDPGKKDDAVADEIRLRVLCRLAQVAPDIEAFANLFGGIEQLQAIARPQTMECSELVPLAEAVRRDAQAAARKCEDAAHTFGGRAASLFETLNKNALKEPPPSTEVDAASAAAWRELVRLEERRNAQQDAIRKASAAKAEIEKAVSTDRRTSDEIDWDLAKVREEIESSHARQRDLEARRREIDQQISECVSERARFDLRIDALKIERRGVEDNERLMFAWRKSISDAEFDDVVTEEMVAAQRKAVNDAGDARTANSLAWTEHKRALAIKKEADEAAETARRSEQQADVYRNAAAGVDNVICQAIVKVAPAHMKIKDGRIMVETDRGLELFTDLSAGERWRIALDIAIGAIGEGGLLPIRQEAWEGLDPANRAAIADHARQRQTWIVTAEADGGELRAELFE